MRALGRDDLGAWRNRSATGSAPRSSTPTRGPPSDVSRSLARADRLRRRGVLRDEEYQRTREELFEALVRGRTTLLDAL